MHRVQQIDKILPGLDGGQQPRQRCRGVDPIIAEGGADLV
jgi:hypothetical protein